MPQYTIDSHYVGYSIKGFLCCMGVSATVIKRVKRIEDGIMLNGEQAYTNAKLKLNDTLIINLPPDAPLMGIMPEPLPLDIVYESEETMVLNKPAGQTVHPTRGYKDGTLANAYCGLMQARGTLRPFRAVNRLDRNTSGLVLCAQNVISASYLAQHVSKVYYAIVDGRLHDAKGTIDAPIDLCEDSIIKRRVAHSGKPSLTQYELIAACSELSLVKVIPITGRTHQIRVHFAHIGHPLVGDSMYGKDTGLISRHALHCGGLTFVEPSGVSIGLTMPLPQDMAHLLAENGLELDL